MRPCAEQGCFGPGKLHFQVGPEEPCDPFQPCDALPWQETVCTPRGLQISELMHAYAHVGGSGGGAVAPLTPFSPAPPEL